MKEKSKNLTIWIFSAASFLNDLDSEMIFPIWPLFITSVLGADMTVLGLIDGLGNAIVSLSQAGSGYLSDKRGRRTILVLSYSLFGLICLGFVYVGSFEGVVTLFILYGLQRAAAEPVQRAFVSELSPT